MSLILSFIGIAILVGVVIKLARARPRVSPTARITAAQIGLVFEKLSAAPPGPAFAVMSFTTPDRPRANDAVDLQLFKEDGRTGFDWPLSTPRNLADQERFLSFAHGLGFLPRPMETNGIDHLRVDDGDLLQLCLRVITELYGQPPDTPIELIIEGFELNS